MARIHSGRPLVHTANGARARISSTSTTSSIRPHTGEDWRRARLRPNAMLAAATRIVAPNTPTSRVIGSARSNTLGEFAFTDLPDGVLSLQIDLPYLTVISALHTMS